MCKKRKFEITRQGDKQLGIQSILNETQDLQPLILYVYMVIENLSVKTLI